MNNSQKNSVQGTSDDVRFIVTDNGHGFSPKDVKEATKQFYRGDSSRNTGNHHGMGLYIAQSIVQNHGGTLLIANDSSSGGGQVTITIPIRNREVGGNEMISLHS